MRGEFTIPYRTLYNTYLRIQLMKTILGIDGDVDNLTEKKLQKEIEYAAQKNIINLVTLNYYLYLMPAEMKNIIKSYLEVIDSRKQFNRFLCLYSWQFKINPVFRKFSDFVSEHMMLDARAELDEQAQFDISLIKKSFLDYKQTNLLLLYCILNDDSDDVMEFQAHGIIHNFPLLLDWADKNKYKPVIGLTHNDCEVIAAGLLNGYDSNAIADYKLNPAISNAENVKEIIEQLPAKFHVKNIVQVVFRILFLNPFFWNRSTHEEIVDAINGVAQNVL